MKKDLTHFRENYGKNWINFRNIMENPITFFDEWFTYAQEVETAIEANAMSLATYHADGFPKNRIVLLKEYSKEGFIFYTNFSSDKGTAIAQHPKVSLHFFWPHAERQVIISGIASKVPMEQSERYFKQRPIESQWGAVLSHQSKALDFERDLEKELATLMQNDTKQPQKPEDWGGYLVKPQIMEFWQGRPSRLHQRLRYQLKDGNWKASRLFP